MMTDENAHDSKPINSEIIPDAADKKGQMLVIYLPEGSVIVDRSDIQLSSVPQVIVEQATTNSVPAPVEPVVERAVPETLQPTLQEVVRLAVAEVLQITGLLQSQGARNNEPISEIPRPAEKESASVIEKPVPVDKTPDAFADYPAPVAKRAESPTVIPVAPPVNAPAVTPQGSRHVYVRRRRKTNWAHGINTLFVAYLVVISIVPGILSAAFGLSIYASNASFPTAMISKGDLLATTQVPASGLKVNDVLVVRDGNSWQLDVRQVTASITSGDFTTVTTASTGGVAVDKTYVLPNSLTSHVLLRVIPELGYGPIILLAPITKILGGLFILILNLWVHFRRSRKRRLETTLR